MVMKSKNILLTVVVLLCLACSLRAETPLCYRAEVSGTVGTGDFTPYYIMSNNGGVRTQAFSGNLRAAAHKDFDLSRRFSYSFGADVIGGYASSVDYLRYRPSETGEGEMFPQDCRPAAVWLQQFYGEIKYRGVFLSVGMKERKSPLFNDRLGSGDFVQSNNARPVPQVRVGFVDFQDIPLTRGWVQIRGELAYGRYVQDSWLEHHYNYRNSFITTGAWFNYKSAYLRSKPSMPFSVTAGMQMGGQFAGTARTYRDGVMVNEDIYDLTFKSFWHMLVPGAGGSNVGDSEYVYGNTVGSWDVMARYRFQDGTRVKAYVQWPFEDGSGIGKLNGFDGIWGLEYESGNPEAIVAGAVVEYIDFTNQSGPIHWAPGNTPGTWMTTPSTGNDSYYTNFRFNSYSNLGMSQGTPFIPSVIYNCNGYMSVTDNRVRGFHVGVSGRVIDGLHYRFLASYRRSWGSYSVPRLAVACDASFMLEGIYSVGRFPGLDVCCQIAVDRGTLLGNNFGVMLSLSYSGVLNLFSK